MNRTSMLFVLVFGILAGGCRNEPAGPGPSQLPPSTRFTAGDTVRTIQEVTVREAPSVGATALGLQPQNSLGMVIGGPSFADNGWWWQVDFGTDPDGWTMENKLASIASGPRIVRSVYVLNEGNFGDPAGARLSVYDVFRDTVYKDVVEAANGGMHLGSTGDDMSVFNGRLYVLMSGSENLDVLEVGTFALVQSGTFAGSTPHDLLIDSLRNKLYLTELYANSVRVVDLSSLATDATVAVGSNPQGMVMADGNLFVCNSGYGSDRTVTVIDADADTVKRTLTLSDGPTGAVLTDEGDVWIVCTGNAFGSPPTAGRVYVIDPLSLAVEDSIVFADNLWGSISAGGDGYVYVVGVTPGSFYGGPVHRIEIASHAVTLNFIPGTYYSISFDRSGEELYAADVKDFAANGEVKIFSNAGTLRKSFAVQRGPSVMAFGR